MLDTDYFQIVALERLKVARLQIQLATVGAKRYNFIHLGPEL